MLFAANDIGWTFYQSEVAVDGFYLPKCTGSWKNLDDSGGAERGKSSIFGDSFEGTHRQFYGDEFFQFADPDAAFFQIG